MYAQEIQPMPLTGTSQSRLPAFPHGWDYHQNRHCIWIVTPNGYVHSRAFEDVALGLHFAFEELGGSAPLTVEPSNWRGRTPIVFGANLLPAQAARWLPKNSVLVNMEQVSEESGWINSHYLSLLQQFPVLDYSARNRDALARLGVTHAGLLQVGYASELTRIEHAPVKDIDVLFYGSVGQRRKDVLIAMQQAGLNVVHLFGKYGEERDAMIARSKIVLNIHHFDVQVFEIVRVSFLLANGVCVVTEGNPQDPDIAPFAEGLSVVPYHQLVERCTALVANDAERTGIAERGLEIMRRFRQSDYLRAAIGS